MDRPLRMRLRLVRNRRLLRRNKPVEIGDYRIEIIPDTEFRLDGGAMFGVVPRVLWERVCPADEQIKEMMQKQQQMGEGMGAPEGMDTGGAPPKGKDKAAAPKKIEPKKK